MKKVLFLVFMLTFAVYAAPQAEAAGQKIRITAGGRVFTATMSDNPAAQDFISLLPITLTFRDYAGAEKIAYPPRELSTSGARHGTSPVAGDWTVYAPWGNIAIFYKDGHYSKDLIHLGKFDSGIEIWAGVSGDFTATIEVM